MKKLLDRNSFDARSSERRQLRRIAFISFVFAIGWYTQRSNVIRAAARSSVGCSWRSGLVVAALPNAGCWAESIDIMDMRRTPEPCWIVWSSFEIQDYDVNFFQDGFRRRLGVADGNLQMMGSFLTVLEENLVSEVGLPLVYPGGDGAPLICASSVSYVSGSGERRVYLSVLRPRNGGNELIWLGQYQLVKPSTAWTNVLQDWQDLDKDGIKEMVLTKVVLKPSPGGVLSEETRNVVATFELDKPDGILRTRKLVENCGVIPWTPPHDAPVWIDSETPLEEILRRFIPLAN